MATRLDKLTQMARGVFAGVALILMLYCVVGSLIFPEWFFHVVWYGQYRDVNHWRAGIEFWTDEHPLLLILGVLLAVVSCFLAVKLRTRLIGVRDRYAGRIIVTCLGLSMAALLFCNWRVLPEQHMLTRVLRELRESTSPRPVNRIDVSPPVHVLFIDTARVDRLYAQIENELIETQRTITSGVKNTNEITADLGAAKGGISRSIEGAQLSTFNRVTSSPERRLLELVTYLSKTGGITYYHNEFTWLVDHARGELITLAEPSPHPTRPQQATQGSYRTELIEKQRQALYLDLEHLSGKVFLDGEFTWRSRNEGQLVLKMPFADEPRRVTFEVALPRGEELEDRGPNSKARLQVFGIVSEPLRKESIKIRPYAIWQ